ncbi:hypothetical protein [Caballeronia grimmiae]|uniref:hypothetical protein n=1 Tax=Caballeronia grimmiae TaxID=1071679 RepID=UPI0038B7B58B
MDALISPRYQNKLIVVAWEHAIVEKAARRIVKLYGGDASSVPRWDRADFDSIYVVRITRRAGKTEASFAVEQQGLNGRQPVCPGR